MAIIEVENVTKQYRLGAIQSMKTIFQRMLGKEYTERTNFKALDNVSFKIERGEVVGIIGHNGAGKSTLLKILSNITTPTSGKVRVNGKIAPLIEVGAGLVGDLTGRENIYLNASILGMTRSEIDKRVQEIIEFSELEEFIDTPVKRYSSGMQVRLGYAIATSATSEILIVDEVLAVGDLSFQQKCIDRMESLIKTSGRTVIMVGHNIRQLERICSRVILLSRGSVKADGQPSVVCGQFFKEAQELAILRHKSVFQSGAEESVGVIDVESISLMNPSCAATPDNFGMHQPLVVKVRFRTNRKLVRPEIVVGLHTSDFVHILSVSSAMCTNRPDVDVGLHELTCEMKSIPLRPFVYGLRLAFLDQYRAMLWYSENLLQVPVGAGDVDVTKLPEIGFIDVPTDWTVKTI